MLAFLTLAFNILKKLFGNDEASKLLASDSWVISKVPDVCTFPETAKTIVLSIEPFIIDITEPVVSVLPGHALNQSEVDETTSPEVTILFADCPAAGIEPPLLSVAPVAIFGEVPVVPFVILKLPDMPPGAFGAGLIVIAADLVSVSSVAFSEVVPVAINLTDFCPDVVYW